MKLLILLMVFLLLSVISSLAQNDPGHDSLYIEQTGDSVLTGSFNVTENVTVFGNVTLDGGEVEINNQFEIRGNGAIPSTNTNFIVSHHDNYISLNSKGNGNVVRLLDQSATGDVLIGLTGTGSVDLNVTNALYVQGTLFSLDTNFELRTNGTFPSTDINTIVVNNTGNSRRMWLTSKEILLAAGLTTGTVLVGEGFSDSIDLNVTGNLTIQGMNGTINGGTICTTTNGLCAGGGGGGARSYGWSNTSTVVSLSDANDNVSAGVFLVDNDNNKIGVNTTDPVQTLHVVGSGNFTDDVYVGLGGRVCTENNGLCPGSSDGNGGWVNNTAQTSTSLDVNVTGDFYVRSITDTIIFIDASSGYIGINTTTPTHTLNIIGTANFTDDLNLETNLTVRGGGIFDDSGIPKIQFTTTKVIIRLG